MVESPVLSLAVVLLASFFAAYFIKKIKIPTITAYIALGIVLSPHVSNLISPQLLAVSDFFSNVVLGMIAFMLGETLSFRNFRQVSGAVMSISLAAALCTWVLVALAFWLFFHQPFYIAIVLGAIASATDPASTVIVTQEYRAKGMFTDTLLGIVAIDDAWALIIFALSLSLARSFAIHDSNFFEVIKAFLSSWMEIIGSFVLGGAVVLIFNRLSRLISTVKERLVYTLGFLFLTIGLALFFNFSVLLACMFMGTLLANTNRRSEHFFESLRTIDTPLYIIFFVLAGANLNISLLLAYGTMTFVFLFFRTAGKTAGAFAGAALVNASPHVKKYMGLALIPQAGVALACALVARHTLGGRWGDLILTITIATTVVFELVGPILTKVSLARSGEIEEK